MLIWAGLLYFRSGFRLNFDLYREKGKEKEHRHLVRDKVHLAN